MRLPQFLCNKVHEFSKKFANFPDSYVKRSMEQVYWKTPRGKPNYLPRTVQRNRFRFTTNRPWTGHFRQQNLLGSVRRKVFVEPLAEWSFFRGDRVEVLVGRDKGKQGIVSQIFPERNWVIVEGLNCHLRRVGADGDFPGIIIRSESPLLVTNQVALVDPSDLQATEFEWRYTEEGEKLRVSSRTGRTLPIPIANEETHDYKSKGAYIEKDADTPAKVVEEITFSAALKTFEMDIMEDTGIKEDRVPHRTYWY